MEKTVKDISVNKQYDIEENSRHSCPDCGEDILETECNDPNCCMRK